ncbi:MAG TPA: BlaI/MecI/CopY family transcriptional regulator [Candidatus Acidoferrum sp.]|nr:BlaI/MecI/CopY family transcriptional regulator [Candidatus Acidoferrum sp.]
MPGSFHFDPEATGTAIFLGPTEALLMDLLWKHQNLTVKQALYHLGGNAELAYTTVMTIMNRLVEKGLLTRTKERRNFVYRPVTDRKTFFADRLAVIRDCLEKNFKASG